MEDLVQRLRQCGIAVTPQRLAVMASLQNRLDHPSAEHIYQEVRRQLPTISFNTVYKALEVLCQKGLVTKVNPLHEVARYDGLTKHHAHLICRQCHHIIDLDWEADAFSGLAPAERHGFQLDYPSLTFWGLCPQCQGPESPQED
jgi:Fe2+ or Zn2+ uptake regulation protein